MERFWKNEDVARYFGIPEDELVCLCEGLECCGFPQPITIDGEMCFTAKQVSVMEEAIGKGDLLPGVG